MQPLAEGWYEVTIPGLRAGTLYKYRINGEMEIPDPASHFQPQDVFGPSEVIDHDRFTWRTNGWRGRPWEETAFLEVHVGTFTPGGTFRAAIEKLDHMVETGVTAIELMPIADFAGRRNWGYDGVLLYAPDSAYGRPDDLRALIDEAHAATTHHRSSHLPTRRGVTPSIITFRRFVPSLSAMHSIGSRAIVSTAFDSMRFMPSSNPGTPRCSMI
jgi:1,4-alpha-glucan branching enzyme